MIFSPQARFLLFSAEGFDLVRVSLSGLYPIAIGLGGCFAFDFLQIIPVLYPLYSNGGKLEVFHLLACSMFVSLICLISCGAGGRCTRPKLCHPATTLAC